MKNTGCRRYLILLLALVMALGLLPARAELFPDGDEMDMVHWAMASAVKMLANAVDEPDSVPPEISLPGQHLAQNRPAFRIIPRRSGTRRTAHEFC